jgi:hypothetical protein
MSKELDFADLIRDIGHGATNREASDLLREIALACQETGKQGTLTIKVTAEMSHQGIVELHAALTTKKPAAPLPGGSYYVTKSGGFVTEDPRQSSLPLTVLPVAPIRGMGDAQ